MSTFLIEFSVPDSEFVKARRKRREILRPDTINWLIMLYADITISTGGQTLSQVDLVPLVRFAVEVAELGKPLDDGASRRCDVGTGNDFLRATREGGTMRLTIEHGFDDPLVLRSATVSIEEFRAGVAAFELKVRDTLERKLPWILTHPRLQEWLAETN